MNNHNQDRNWTRRGFLRGTGLVGMGGVVGALANRPTSASTAKSLNTTASTAYDLERLRKIDPKLIHYEETGRIRSPYQEPKRIAGGAHGKILLSAGKHLVVLDSSANTSLDISLPEEIRCVAVAKDGALFAGLRDSVRAYNADGEQTSTWKVIGKTPWLTSLAVAENHLFAADAANRIVLHYDVSGKLLGRIGEKSKTHGTAGFLVPSPYFDLEIGSDGFLWIVNPGHHRLEAYTFDGTFQSCWGQPSFGITGFCGCCNPSYFTRLADGRFVTSEKGLARIKIYSAKGEFESVVAGPEAFPKYFENPNATPVALDVAADSSGRILIADTLGSEIRVFQRKQV